MCSILPDTNLDIPIDRLRMYLDEQEKISTGEQEEGSEMYAGESLHPQKNGSQTVICGLLKRPHR